MSIKLVHIDGPEKGKEYSFEKSEILIGRSDTADCQLSDILISRQHARITFDGSDYFVDDSGSRFGTILNNQPVRHARLSHGDSIRIGRYNLQFLIHDKDAPADGRGSEYDSQLISRIRSTDFQLGKPADETVAGLKESNAQLMSLLELSSLLHGSLELERILSIVLEKIFQVLKPDRGYILLVNPVSGDIQPAVAKIGDKAVQSLDRIPISSTICEKVILNKEAVATTDAMSDKRFETGVSVHNFSIRSALCAPMIHRDRVVGLIHVDIKGLTKCFSDGDLKILMAITSTAASAVAIAMLRKEKETHERIRSNLSRFFSPNVMEEVISRENKVDLKGERMLVSILFSDLRGFTGMSQSLDVEKVVLLLNRFFSMASTCLFKHKGTLDKFLGDGLMAIFGAPVSFQDSAACAVRAGMDIITHASMLNEVVTHEGLPRLEVGVSVTTGEVIAGTIGSSDRLEYTAIGNTVNLAARLVGVARAGELLVDSATADKVNKEFTMQDMGRVAVKGFTGKIQYFQVTGSSAAGPG